MLDDVSKFANIDNKNILITGATGFLGSFILKELIEKSNCKLIVLKRSFSDTKRIENYIESTRVKTYDIDKIELSQIFEENNINVIIHCATDYGREGSCEKVLKTNLILPINLIELGIKHSVDLFINTDSYFNKDNMSYLYLQNYSLSKKTLLLWLKNFSKQIKIINVVLEHIYGENDSLNKFAYSMVQKIAIQNSESIDCTNGEQKRDFIYIKDVSRAYLFLLEYGLSHRFRYKTYNLGTGIAHSVKDFLLTIKHLSRSNTTLNFGAIRYRDDEIMVSVADTIDLNDLGWYPIYSLETGLKSMIDSVKEV